MKIIVIFIGFIFINPIIPQDSQKFKKPISNTFYITSDPSDANVYINDSLYGKTPLGINNFNLSYFSLKLIDNENNMWRMNNVGSIDNRNNIHALINKDYALLKITSSPSNAELYLNDTLIGKTPLDPIKISLGTNSILLKKEGFFDYKGNLTVTKEFTQQFNFDINLKNINGILDLSSISPSSEIYIDNVMVNNTIEQLGGGEHSILIKDLQKRTRKSLDFSIKPGLSYRIITKDNQFMSEPVFLSLILPGMGQFLDESKLKGIGILIGFGGLLAGTLISSNNYSNHLENYNLARIQYLNSKDELSALGNKQILDAVEKDKNKALNLSKVFFGLTITTYFLNLVDVLLFHSVKDVLELKILDIETVNTFHHSLKFNIESKLFF